MIKILQIKSNWIFLLLFGILAIACEDDPRDENGRVLPVYGNKDLAYKMVDGVEIGDSAYPSVPEFEYLNQDSVWISNKDMEGKVRIVDFFFSHCPTMCPPMTSQMKRLSTRTKDIEKYIVFNSFSIDPKRDTPARLREYIEMHGITAKNWSFLTGIDANYTHEMARKYFSYAAQDDNAAGGYGHSPFFVIVDRDGLVRGTYDGQVTEQVDSLENDLRMLLKYEYGIDDAIK